MNDLILKADRFRIPPTGLILALVLSAAPLAAAGPGVFKFDERRYSVAEEAGAAVISVERSRGEDGAVGVTLSAVGGSATAGSDFLEVSVELLWEDGDEGVRTVVVPILDDADREGAETVQLSLSDPTGGATLDPLRSQVTLTIRASDGGDGEDDGEDDGPGNGKAGVLKFDQRAFHGVEGSEALISVERSQGETGAVTVDYAVAAGTAEEGTDFTAVQGTLSWESGDGGSKSFAVPLADDGVAEPIETVLLSLSNPTGGAALHPQRHEAVLSIHDVGGRPPGDRPGASAGELEIDERSLQVIESAGSARVLVERSRGKSSAVSVEVSTADLSATAGEDYEATSTVLSWAHGEGGRKAAIIPIFDDELEEGNEQLFVLLSNPTGGVSLDAEDAAGVLTVLDDDGATDACVGDDATLCLLGGRFEVEILWRKANGETGRGTAVPQSDRSGFFWFFSPDNVEMLFKVIDACELPAFESFWIFFAATTNVDFTLTVTDTVSGVMKEYTNPSGQAAEPVQDTLSFRTCS